MKASLVFLTVSVLSFSALAKARYMPGNSLLFDGRDCQYPANCSIDTDPSVLKAEVELFLQNLPERQNLIEKKIARIDELSTRLKGLVDDSNRKTNFGVFYLRTAKALKSKFENAREIYNTVYTFYSPDSPLVKLSEQLMNRTQGTDFKENQKFIWLTDDLERTIMNFKAIEYSFFQTDNYLTDEYSCHGACVGQTIFANTKADSLNNFGHEVVLGPGCEDVTLFVTIDGKESENLSLLSDSEVIKKILDGTKNDGLPLHIFCKKNISSKTKLNLAKNILTIDVSRKFELSKEDGGYVVLPNVIIPIPAPHSYTELSLGSRELAGTLRKLYSK
jgi:hypothetical protein